MEMFIVSSGAVQVSICAFVILLLSFVVGQGGGWTQWQHHLCDSWTRGLFWGDRPPGHWRHEQANSQHQGEYSDAKFVLRFLVLTFCRRTASQLCLFSSSGISKPQWRTIQRTRLCSRGEKVFWQQFSNLTDFFGENFHRLLVILAQKDCFQGKQRRRRRRRRPSKRQEDPGDFNQRRWDKTKTNTKTKTKTKTKRKKA